VLAVTAAAGAGRYLHGFSNTVAFVLAGVSLAGLAWLVSVSTEQLGQRFGPASTGVLQSTVGNLPEFFVVVFALQARDTTVAETAILGSILVNALLLLGLVLVAGSLRAPDRTMRFSPRLPNDTATLLLVASFIIVLLGLVDATGDPASHHTETISVTGAIAILVVYAVWLAQYLSTPDGGGAGEPTAREPTGGGATAGPDRARLTMPLALGLLVGAGAGSAFVSDWFVHALEPTIRTLHISQAFAGLVIVAIAGNAVEHVAGVFLAARGRTELAISVVKNSVAQVAAFLFPVLVLVSLLTASRLTFAIPPVYIGALFGSAVLVWQITGDGEATPFEGVALIATFVILATVAGFEH
jgi:Ca2+:H+ antiporter